MRTLSLTSPHMTGPDVKAVQARLHGVDVDGEYGPKTAEAVKSWRYRVGMARVNYTLPPRAQRVMMGDEKRTASEIARAKARAVMAKREQSKAADLGSKALAVAVREIGVKETPAGSNSGPRVREYQSTCDIGGTGWPWCAAFVTWCFKRSGRTLKGFNQAYCPSWEANARAGKGMSIISNPADVRPGDVVTFDWRGDGVADHIGIVATKVVSGRFQAIEGNTSYGNDSNGGQVMRRDRNLSQVSKFIRVK